jgi:hypothetical protein
MLLDTSVPNACPNNLVVLIVNQIRQSLLAESYTPRTWRTHTLHICPSDPYDATDVHNKKVLDWIFLISALNFSFWSEKEGTPQRYGVEWRCGLNSEERTVHTGYWSLVAALDRGWSPVLHSPFDVVFLRSQIHSS